MWDLCVLRSNINVLTHCHHFQCRPRLALPQKLWSDHCSYLGSLGSFGLAAGLSPINEPSTGAWETESAVIERALEGGPLRADPRRRQERFLRYAKRMQPSGRRIPWWNNPGGVEHGNATAAVVLRGRMDNSTDIATLKRSKNKRSIEQPCQHPFLNGCF